MRKKILYFVFLSLLTVVVFSFQGCRKRDQGAVNEKIQLTYYKLYDDEDVMKPLIAKFQQSHPNISVRYRKFEDIETYEDLILNELAEGEGPDIFEVRNSAVPRYLKKITPLQSTTVTPQVIEETYVPAVAEDFVQKDPKDGIEKIFGLPMSMDVPVIYYNKDIFDRELPEQGKPPSTWGELINTVALLRDTDSAENIRRGGIAMGRSDNISRSFEILMNLFLQEGVSFYNKDFKKASFASGEGAKALDFYASFGDKKFKQYSWDEFSVSSSSDLREIEAFLTGKTAMILGYSDILSDLSLHRKNIKAKGFSVISENSIAVAPFPQSSDDPADKSVLAWYLGETVSRTSAHPKEAWQLVYFLSENAQAKNYLNATNKVSARRDLLEEQKKDRNLSAFVSQVGFAKSIPVFNERKYREFLEEAVTNRISGKSASESLKMAQELINALIGEEGIYPPVPKVKLKN